MTFPTSPNASMTHVFGQKLSKKIFFHLCRWLDICGQHGFVQNPQKFVFGSNTVEFAGLVITPTNIQPRTNISAQSRTFLRHISLTSDLGSASSTKCSTVIPYTIERHLSASSSGRRYLSFGMISYIKFLSNSGLLCCLLDEVTEGVWIFDSKLVPCLATIWFKEGIGFWLLQKYCICEVITPI